MQPAAKDLWLIVMHEGHGNGEAGPIVDTILIDSAYILAGDSKFRLGSRRDKGQAPTLSFTYDHAGTLVFLHLDGDFSYSRTGYYPESNSLELYLDLKSATMLAGVLGNIVPATAGPGVSPEIPVWKHTPESPLPMIVEEYTVQAKAITVAHPMNLALKPRTIDGFTTYVALTRPRLASGEVADITFRLKFWLTERSIPELELLQRCFRHGLDNRTQPMHVAFMFAREELAALQRQLEVLRERYLQETA